LLAEIKMHEIGPFNTSLHSILSFGQRETLVMAAQESIFVSKV